MNSSTVLANLHDSVSRIIDNFQFTHVEQAAHARLVSLLMEKLAGMSDTCRALLENSGRTGAGLNATIDLKYVFQMHHVDLRALVEYTQQVHAFPPRPFEIHGDESSEAARRKRAARLEMENSKKLSSKKANSAMMIRHPTPPVYSIPIYDGMSPLELGFNNFSDDGMTPPATPLHPEAPPPSTNPPCPDYYLQPPPPPPPIPPLSFFSDSLTPPHVDTLYNIPSFDPQVPPPNYSNPEPVVKLKLFKADPPLPPPKPVEKWPKFEKYRAPKRLPEKRKIEPAVAPKMTKKRLMQTNYERRLRNEQMAIEERKKEKQLEMKLKQKEKERKWERMLRKEAEITPRKFKERLPKRSRAEDNEKPSKDPQPKIQKDENENYKILTPKKIQKFTSSEFLNSEKEAVVSRAPLPKIRISYSDANQGRLIKKVEFTEFQNVKGAWKPTVRTWQNKHGVFSRTNFPNVQRRRRCGSITLSDSPLKFRNLKFSKNPKIPKVKLIRNSDNSYSRV